MLGQAPIILEYPAEVLILLLDGIGVFVFAISGATLALRQRLDLFGVLMLAFVTALFGGITRDLLLGATPPETLTSWHNFAIAMVGGTFTIYAQTWVERIKWPVRLFDAIGLGLFAAAGTQKALAYGVDPLMAAVVGMITGIGGGILRDVLVTRTPLVLQSEIYAVAALAGGIVVTLGAWVGLPALTTMLIGAALCVALRLLGLYRQWTLAVPRRRLRK
ncbi:trimeric intracellular cation channel family protein [Oleomonas cavernae]|uniref:Trimeric intracellular cation channel family protein n=1 Tax=Oleomonas cavernae TaxID=2320859 RepID=A0A418WAV5_9PROT|nr:trimeric intracellular cation channel family protein [Oleomonas cavernae]RJF87171.1 trimeric intracellular cation channel family protein [Oleomonas cavernae]